MNFDSQKALRYKRNFLKRLIHLRYSNEEENIKDTLFY